MRMSSLPRERKTSQSASSKIDNIIKQLFIPMLTMSVPQFTSFQPDELEVGLIHQVAQSKPSAMDTESSFVDYMVHLYKKFYCQEDAMKE